MKLTEHFTTEELTRTNTGIENDPSVEHGANLVRLAVTLLEPIRAMLGYPLIVHSGYRSEAVNHAVGGARNSAHLEGRACDFHPGGGASIRNAFDAIRTGPLPYDKLILEHRSGSWWIHVQIARSGEQARRLAYIAELKDGSMRYTPVSR